VHVSASWFEVAPLVDLEAAASGCAVVASRAGYTHEYLGDAALYVDPTDGIDQLRTTILQALKSAPEMGARALERVRQYTWKAAAAKLLTAYNNVLGMTR
jgi:glycosyltransferase involved in cell wall biosynthesis